LISLNFKIGEFNISYCSSCPLLHTWGISRHATRHFVRGGQAFLREGHGQETKDILHLDNYARIRIGKICIYYFKAIYKKTEFKAKSKNKGLQLLRYGTI